MQCKWLGERVAAPNLKLVVKNAITRTPAGNWGPNATFRFPARGGTGGIWKAVAELLPRKNLLVGKIVELDLVHKLARLDSGGTIAYDKLVSTMNVDHFVDIVRVDSEADKSKIEKVKEATQELVYSNTIVIGLGMRGKRPERIGDKCESGQGEQIIGRVRLTNRGSGRIRLALLSRGQYALLPGHHLFQLLAA